jgi:hypothetical protein
MLNHEYPPVECGCTRSGSLLQSSFLAEARKPGPMGLIVASMLGVIVWLIFILLYALYWSGGFTLFQNVVVFIVSACITGLLIAMMWIISAPEKYRTWGQ